MTVANEGINERELPRKNNLTRKLTLPPIQEEVKDPFVQKASSYPSVTSNLSPSPSLYSTLLPEDVSVLKSKIETLMKERGMEDAGMDLKDCNLESLEKIYKDLEEQTVVSDNMGNWIYAFTLGLLFIECVSKKVGLDAKGITKLNISRFPKYIKMMADVGRKYGVVEGKGWPTEIRIVGNLIISSGLFLGVKYFSGKDNDDVITLCDDVENRFRNTLDTKDDSSKTIEVLKMGMDVMDMFKGGGMGFAKVEEPDF